MLCKALLALAVLGLAATSQAAVIITGGTGAGVPAPGLEGYTTYTLTATAPEGEKIVGFDFVGDGSLGFFGPMNQLTHVAVPTAVFNDSNSVFTALGLNPLQDSQFTVPATGNFAVNPSEGPDHLQAAFNFGAHNQSNLTNVLQFVQLTIPDTAAQVSYYGTFTVRDPSGGERLDRVQGIWWQPSYAQIDVSLGGMLLPSGGSVDLGVAQLGSSLQQTFSIANPGIDPLVLREPMLSGPFSLVGDFPTTVSPGAMVDFVIAADTSNLGTLSGALEFSTNVYLVETFALDLGAQVVPEPSAGALLGLALVGLIGYARRK